MEIKGQIDDIIFVNENNSYTVCSIVLEKEIITAVGYLPFINIGDIIVAKGDFVKHNTYGEQFKIETFEKTMPNTTKEIEKYLGSDYKVVSSKGHIRDLATSGKFGFGVDLENHFEPNYVAIKGKKKDITALKKDAEKAKMVYLATDPDREGEAISWHLATALKLDEKKMRRITFNEITKNAVKASLNPTPCGGRSAGRSENLLTSNGQRPFEVIFFAPVSRDEIFCQAVGKLHKK